MSKAPANSNTPPLNSGSSHDQQNMLGHGFSKKLKLEQPHDWSFNSNFKTLPPGQDTSQMFQNYNYDQAQNQQQQPQVSMATTPTANNQSAIPSTQVSVTAANTV